jgi:glycosyltransferase involved in cell wall biosynthesis
MRVVLVSTHIDQTTGYSKVAYQLLRQLATLSPKVKTFHYGFQRHPSRTSFRKYPENISSYDAAANEDPKEDGFGFNKIHEYLEMVNPDLVMIYNDPLIVYRFIEAMKHDPKTSPYKLWVYVDQVYDGIAPPLMDKLREHSDRVYAFTDIWKKKLEQYGEFKEVCVLEHAVDPMMFSILTKEAKSDARKSMNLPDDAVVMLNANRNSQRKRLDITVAGFVQLLKKYPTKPYYLIIATNVNPQLGAYYDIGRIYGDELTTNGLDIASFANRLLLIDTSPPNVVGDDGINKLYNAADIGINTSDGEGFGLCQLEHLYTGAPQIVCDIGSYRTFLNEEVAEFIPTHDRVYFAGTMPLGFYAPSFRVQDVLNAMERSMDTLDEKRKAIKSYTFKSWASVCDGFLEDILKLVQ